MKSNYYFPNFSTNNIDGKISVTINEQQFSSKDGELTLNGILAAINNPTDEDRANERIRLGAERRRIWEEEVKRKRDRKQENAADTDIEVEDSCAVETDIETEDSCVPDEDTNQNCIRVTSWILRRAATEAAKTSDGKIILYDNGYAIYTNDFGNETVLWVPALKKYSFDDMTEKPDYRLNIKDLEEEAWYVAVALFGDYQINDNQSKHTISKLIDNSDKARERVDGDRNDDGEDQDDGPDEDDGPIKYRPYRFEDPEKALIKKEAFSLLMNKLKPVQRNVILAYHVMGFAYEEIADALGRDRSTVIYHYDKAADVIGKQGIAFFEEAPNIERYCGEYMDAGFVATLMHNQPVKGCRQRRLGRKKK